MWVSIQRGGHFTRVDEAENSGSDFGRLSEIEVRFNWMDSDNDIGDFKCKLIDLSIVHDNRVSDNDLSHRIFLQHEQKHGKLGASICLNLKARGGKKGTFHSKRNTNIVDLILFVTYN